MAWVSKQQPLWLRNLVLQLMAGLISGEWRHHRTAPTLNNARQNVLSICCADAAWRTIKCGGNQCALYVKLYLSF